MDKELTTEERMRRVDEIIIGVSKYNKKIIVQTIYISFFGHFRPLSDFL